MPINRIIQETIEGAYLRAIVEWHSHPYAVCPHCNEEQEVEESFEVVISCSFCHKRFMYSTKI